MDSFYQQKDQNTIQQYNIQPLKKTNNTLLYEKNIYTLLDDSVFEFI